MAGRGEGIPGDVEPGGGGQELVGKLPVSEEVDQCMELRRVFRTNVGSLADQVLGVLNAAHLAIDGLAAEAGIDDDRAHECNIGTVLLLHMSRCLGSGAILIGKIGQITHFTRVTPESGRLVTTTDYPAPRVT